MTNKIYKGINQSYAGAFKVQSVNATTGEVKWESDWKKNLILNQGMDGLASQYIADVTKYGVIGEGTRPNNIDSTTSAITQSGTLAFLNVRTGGIADFTSSLVTYAAAVQVGDTIKYSDNSESMVAAVDAGGFMLTLSQSYTFTTNKTFVIWKTAQVGLQSETKRAGTGITGTEYLTGAGNCETTTVANTRTWRRTYDFTSESVSKDYYEAGVSWATSGATTVFNRILFDPFVTIDSGFKLRLIYDLAGTFTPASDTFRTASIGGWPVAPATTRIGSESLQNFLTSTIQSSDGASVTNTGILDPSFINNGAIQLAIWGSTSSVANAAFGSGIDRSTGGSFNTSLMTKTTYIPNSFYLDKNGAFTTGELNSSNIRSLGLGRYQVSVYNPYASTNNVISFVFDQAQTKNSAQTLSLTYRWVWTRTLA